MTPRISPVDPITASTEVYQLLERTQRHFECVPNLHATLASAPVALRGYLDFQSALALGRLSPVLANQIGLLVSDENGSRYCVAVYAQRCAGAGLPSPELLGNQRGESQDARVAAALRFAAAVLDSRGRVMDCELAGIRKAGFDNEEIGEIIAHVALTCFENFFGHVARPEPDAPCVPLTTDPEQD